MSELRQDRACNGEARGVMLVRRRWALPHFLASPGRIAREDAPRWRKNCVVTTHDKISGSSSLASHHESRNGGALT
jgi:hypothetical protein